MTNDLKPWEMSRIVRQANARERVEALVDDIEFLMHPDLGGETNPDRIASRVGYPNKLSLARLLYRHGYRKLAFKFESTGRPRGRTRKECR